MTIDRQSFNPLIDLLRRDSSESRCLSIHGSGMGDSVDGLFASGARACRQLTLSCSSGALALALLLGCTAGSASSPSAAQQGPLLSLDFDDLPSGSLPAGTVIRTQFPSPDVVPGVIGKAWRTDGFSSYAESNLAIDARKGFTLSLWVALESYPADLEVPVAELKPSSLAQQWLSDSGFDLHLDAFGRWGFKVATTGGILRVAAPQRFPLRRWVHVAVVVDTEASQLRLYQDRQLIGAASGKAGTSLRLAAAPFKLATPPVEATMLDFKVNRINGAYDLVAVHAAPLSESQVAQLPGPVAVAAMDAEPALQVPPSRFARDGLRPRVHPLPPANWTNEPHGLVLVGDTWHLFYQRTPNGPFKTLMTWGHMSSRDLVTWTHLPDALRPELQTDTFGFDMKGIWSGHVYVEGKTAFAFYTSVNHGDRISASNPGIAMAISDDPQLREWRKTGPILNSQGVRDFRDPFVWKQGDTLHMIVGASLDSGGGLAYYTLSPGLNPPRWQMQQRFTDTAYKMLDPGSQIWEMPVFQQLSDSVWVLLVNPIGGRFTKYGEQATRAQYWTGEWANGVFKPFFREPKYLDLLPGHLAPTVARAADGRLRAIGIIDERRSSAAQLRAGWAHTFSLPRVWTLLPDQLTLGQAPAPELTALRAAPLVSGERRSISTSIINLGDGAYAYELQLDVDSWPVDAGILAIDVMGSADGREVTRLLFDRHNSSVSVDLSRSSLSGEREGPDVLKGAYDARAFGPMSRLRVIVDGSVIQVFVNDAAAYGIRSYPSLAASTQMRISAMGPSAVSAVMSLWPLRQPPS